MSEIAEQELISLLSEFFHPKTSNEKKKEIESCLESIQTNPAGLNICLNLLHLSHNEMVLMFCLHCWQEALTHKWPVLNISLKVKFRQFCLETLPKWSEDTNIYPHYLTTKLTQLTADVARVDWPNDFEQFSTSITTWFDSPDSAGLGLQLLQTATEEFFANKNALLTLKQHKTQIANFKSFVIRVWPKFEAILNAIMDQTYQSLSISQNSNITVFELVRQNLNKNGNFLESNVVKLSIDVIKCLTLLIEYHCIESTVLFRLGPNSLIDQIMALVYFGSVRSIQNQKAVEFTDVLFQCLSELICRPLTDCHCSIQEKLSQTFLSFISVILEDFIKINLFDSLDESLIQRFVDLLRSVMFHHLPRLHDQRENVERFLVNLCVFTNSMTDPELFCVILRNVWHIYMDYLLLSCETQIQRNQKWSPSLENLSRLLIQRISLHSSNNNWQNHFQFPKDAIEIHELSDSEPVDDPNEWTYYLRSVCDLLAKISDFNPEAVFGLCRVELEKNLTDLYNPLTNNIRLSIAKAQSLLTAISRLSFLFIGEAFHELLPEARNLLERFCQVVVFVTQSPMTDDLAFLLSGLLLSIRAYSHWLAEFYAEAQRSGELNAEVSALITASLDSSVSILITSIEGHQTPQHLRYSAVSLLFSILTTVRPHVFVLSMKNITTLYNHLSVRWNDCMKNLSPQICKLLVVSCTSYLALPWYGLTDIEQEWNTRRQIYRKVINALLNDLVDLLKQTQAVTMDSLGAVQSTLEWIIPIISEMLSSLEHERVKTRQIAYVSFGPIASQLLSFISLNCEQNKLIELGLTLLKTIFHALSVQLGPDYTKETVQILIRLTSKNNKESQLSARAVLSLLSVLSTIAREMSKSFSQFTESILSLSLENLLPLIVEQDDSLWLEVRAAFYDLLFSLLDVRWRYFFPPSVTEGNVMATANQNSSTYFTLKPDWSSEDGLKLIARRGEQFVAVLEAFGHNIQYETQPEILKQNLTNLKALNEKWSLFRKPIFQSRLLAPYVQLIISLILENQHSLLMEDLYEILYHVTCSTDQSWHWFCDRFIADWLTEICKLSEQQTISVIEQLKLESDLPSFCANLQNAISEIRMYKLCN